MHTSTRIRLTILVLFATLAGCATTALRAPAPATPPPPSDAVSRELHETRPVFTGLAPDEQAVVHVWLFANCAVDAGERRTQLVKGGARMEASLIEAFNMGPPGAFLLEVATTRRSDYSAIQQRLAAEDRDLFSPELRERIAGVSESAYVSAGIERTIVNHQIAALNGLASIGSDASIIWLERTAVTLKDPELRDAVARTVTSIRARQRQ